MYTLGMKYEVIQIKKKTFTHYTLLHFNCPIFFFFLYLWLYVKSPVALTDIDTV